MIFPILVIAIGGFVTGDFSNHQVDSNSIAASVEFYGDSPTFFNQFVMVMVWMYILGWSTYGPEAGATFAPGTRTRPTTRGRRSPPWGRSTSSCRSCSRSSSSGRSATTRSSQTTTGVVWLTDVVNSIAGEGFGKFLVVCLCAGLLLSMNTATMDGSRALYALSEER